MAGANKAAALVSKLKVDTSLSNYVMARYLCVLMLQGNKK
jgi:hypothetical protein